VSVNLECDWLQALQAAMPPVMMVEGDESVLHANTARMPPPLNTRPLPPATVTEKGESLDEFIMRAAPE
jgi:hypothetical protein